MIQVLLTLAGVLVWQTLALATIMWIRPDLAGETRDALINTWLWPAGIVVNKILWPIVKRRRERARQARLSARAHEAGEPLDARASWRERLRGSLRGGRRTTRR